MSSESNIHTLDNGLTLVGEPMPSAQGCSLAMVVKTGSRNERDGEFGISHFLEHMAFKGTKNLSAMDQTLAFGNIGAQVNAYTSDEQTVYYGTVMSEHFERLHEILFEMMRPALHQEDFDVEKQVILEEIALYQDRPGHVLYEGAMADFFGGVGVGQSVLGSTESVSAIDRDTMSAYVERRYAATNIVVSVAGNFDWDLFRRLSEERCSEWKRLSNVDSSSEMPQKIGASNEGAVKVFTHDKCGEQAHLLTITEGPDAMNPLRYPALLVSVVVGDSHNSRLYWKLVETGVAEYASVSPEEKDGVGCVMMSTSMPVDRVEEVRDIVNEEFLLTESIKEEELEIAKSKLLSRMVMEHELALGRAMSHGLNQQYRKENYSLQEEMGAVKNVTLKDCQEFIERYPLENSSSYLIKSAA